VRLWHAVAVLTVCSGLVEGCNSMIVEHVATPARDARAKRVLRSLASGERDALLANARFGDDSAAAQKGLAQLDSIFRGLHLDSMQLIGANEFSTPGMDRVRLSYEVHSERGWLVANVTTVESDGTPALIGLHAEPLVGELRKLNEFSLRGRGSSQYLALILVIALAAWTLGVAGFLATRREFPRRWRWVAASLIGVSAVYVNWTTGEVSSQLFTVQLFSAGAVRASEFAPWILAFSFPVGTLIALERYRKWRAERNSSAPATVVTDSTPPSEAAT
jgi:hypothetical protein